jgi:hypothetical protein
MSYRLGVDVGGTFKVRADRAARRRLPSRAGRRVVIDERTGAIEPAEMARLRARSAAS